MSLFSWTVEKEETLLCYMYLQYVCVFPNCSTCVVILIKMIS